MVLKQKVVLWLNLLNLILQYQQVKHKYFQQHKTGQEAVTIMIYQGESKIANRNKLVGQFNLTGIVKAPRRSPTDRGDVFTWCKFNINSYCKRFTEHKSQLILLYSLMVVFLRKKLKNLRKKLNFMLKKIIKLQQILKQKIMQNLWFIRQKNSLKNMVIK